MATVRAFAYNTGSTFPNTIQFGSVTVQTGSPVTKTLRWWNGPDENLGYVIAHSVPGGNQPNPNDEPAYIGFWRSLGLTDSAFLAIANYVAAGQQTFTNTASAVTWLNDNGYWTSFVSIAINYTIVSATDDSSFGIKNGQVYAWGKGLYGRLGTNSTSDKSTPVSICGATKTFCKIAGGGDPNSTLAIDKYGQIWGWGYNAFVGVLGNNSKTNVCTPVSVCGVKKTFCHVGINYFYGTASAIDKYGQVWGWGYNLAGNIGNNSTVDRSTPVSVCGAKKTFCKIGVGEYHVSSIDKNGGIWGWGLNAYGELGDNSTTARSTPVAICGVKKTFCHITATNSSNLAIDKYGQVWGWGYNNYGQLATNSTNPSSTPIAILGVKKTFCKIAGGTRHVIAIDKNGNLWGWGFGYSGQIGNNGQSFQVTTPVRVCNNNTFCEISAGLGHSIGVDSNNKVWAWGSSSYGQLGNNTNVGKLTPIAVCVL